ncbi:homeobox protein CDX-4-like [Hyperolius riggenbachi]|uniref:homeobox protein CDX-4-like n=1 Tax=Hyperolius riggenbachi TaxID=752182 RepID=UPI0035A3B341
MHVRHLEDWNEGIYPAPRDYTNGGDVTQQQNISPACFYTDYMGYQNESNMQRHGHSTRSWGLYSGAAEERNPCYGTENITTNSSTISSESSGPMCESNDYRSMQQSADRVMVLTPINALQESTERRQSQEWEQKNRHLVHKGITRTKEKYRVVYTDHQRLELEREFLSNRYISVRRKSEIALSLGLTDRQVKIWFQNRRAKERKSIKKAGKFDGSAMNDSWCTDEADMTASLYPQSQADHGLQSEYLRAVV